MKNILILVMANQDEFNGKPIETIEHTWAEDIINGEYSNITFFSYGVMDEDLRDSTFHVSQGVIDSNCNSVIVPTDDDIYSTMDKTLCTFRTLHNYLDKADYVLKCDCTVFVNVRLLDDLVSILPDDDERIYGGVIGSPKYTIGPYAYCLYAKGSAMLFPAKYYKDILTKTEYKILAAKTNKNEVDDEYMKFRRQVDDHAFGTLIDSYLINGKKNHVEYYQDWGMKKLSELDEADIPKQVTIDLTEVTYPDRNDTWKYLQEVIDANAEVEGSELENLSYVVDYINDENTPVILQENEPGTEEYNYPDYLQWLYNNTDIPYLDGVDSSSAIDSSSSFNIIIDGYNLSFEEYYNMPKRELIIDTRYKCTKDILLSEITSLRNEINDLKAQLGDTDEDADDLSKRVATNESDIDALEQYNASTAEGQIWNML